MPAVDFGAQRKQAEESGMLGGGDIYKLKEGDNRIRLMSECLPHQNEFKGQKSFKWLCYVLDRRDSKVKPFFMAHKIYKAIEALQMNTDYAFTDVPMPYDLTIHAKNAGTMEVEYTVMPARKEVALTVAEHDALAEVKPLKELQDAIKAKQNKTPATDETPHPAEGDEPPF
jgi:hypothetical protein